MIKIYSEYGKTYEFENLDDAKVFISNYPNKRMLISIPKGEL